MTQPTLIIFDSLEALAGLPALSGMVHLMPLTGDASVVNEAKLRVFNHIAPGGELVVLEAGSLVNEQVGIIRDALCNWNRRVGDAQIWKRSLKRWLGIPGTGASAWWFSRVAERNPFKSSAYLNAAQCAAVRALCAEHAYGLCIVAVDDALLSEALHDVCATGDDATGDGGAGVDVTGVDVTGVDVSGGCSVIVQSPPAKPGIRAALKRFFDRHYALYCILAGFAVLLRFFWQGYKARKALPALQERLPDNNSILGVSYYPSADPAAAKEGVFKSRYYGPLQAAVEDAERPMCWLFMHVKLGGTSFADSVADVATFIAQGAKMYLLQEFCLLSQLPKALLRWGLLACKGIFLRRYVRSAMADAPFDPVTVRFLMRDWWRSTAGNEGAEGVLFYTAYRNAFTRLTAQDAHAISDTVYCLEMHAWEKALCQAARDTGVTRTIGFQHAAFSRNYFHFYHHPQESGASKGRYGVPLPDVIAASGAIPAAELRSCGYPVVKEVESIRTLYVSGLLETPMPERSAEPVLLAAGSISAPENITLASMATETVAQETTITLLFKGHPMCPFEPILQKIGVDAEASGFRMLGGSVADALAEAHYVIVPTTTVSIEALAFGCRVFLPVTPDMLFMNPLGDFVTLYTPVSTPDALRATLRTSVEETGLIVSEETMAENRAFVREYWHLDAALPRWKDVLHLNN